ncbi:MAG: malate dehydrogenase [Candidatus Omnitrophica bacterium]|nr:malate dehydrogenase [Candidatus Omnitrophota bacterium]
MKISIIGAGNVGATLAKMVIESDTADVVLLDVVKNVALGKALDLSHAAPLVGQTKRILGTDNYKDTAGSHIAVITAGFPRQPGMSRADLIKKNGGIVRDVVNNIKSSSPDAIIIVVTNPLDVMTYIAYKESSFERNRVMGMAGVLDSSRFTYLIAKKLNVEYKEIETIILGQHGPLMVPVISHTKVSGRPINEVLSSEEIDLLIRDVMESGGEIVNLLGKGSAYYAPSASCFTMIKNIINDEKNLLSACVYAEGDYGLSGLCIGLPVRLGKKGCVEVAKLRLDKDELDSLKKAAESIKELLSGL